MLTRSPAQRLFLLSFLILFVELVLIRWAGAFVVYLSYFTNFVLLSSFLGIGLGFLRPSRRLLRFAPAALALVLAVVYFFPTRLRHVDGSVLYFGARQHVGGTPLWLALPIVFLAVAGVLMLLASEAASAFGQLEPLAAYRYDLAGSIAGVLAFGLMSLLSAPPLAWLSVVSLVFLALLPRPGRVQLLVLAALLVPAGLASFRLTWSPYYAIETVRERPQVYDVLVNGVPHQTIEPIKLRPARANYYFVPYARIGKRNPLREVLVVGAGSGPDVAVALARGAKHVDAVEIDPELLALGRRLNADRPYSDPRVATYVDDGRAFLERTRRRYDLVVFALPDSLALLANQSSLRLESYLFTLEAMRAVRAHLTAGGAFAMYNFFRRQWLVDRYARTLSEAFGHPPCVDEQLGRGTLGPMANLTIARGTGALTCPHLWSSRTAAPAPATDDHPFPYLRSRGLPGLYLLTLALILGASLVSTRLAAGRIHRVVSHLDLFCMGAAFLLLETKSVVQFALLFGTTWIVNAFVFLGILLAVLAAVEIAARTRFRNLYWLYLLLLGALALAWAVPSHALLGLGFGPRLAAVIGITFLPVFVANLLFADRFRESSSSTTAFAANLLGAMVGGLLEYSSLVIGYRNLILLVALLYVAAALVGPIPVKTARASLAAALRRG